MTSVDATVVDPRTATATSLTRPGARMGISCSACGSERVTSLAMTLTDGSAVTFRSCHECEHRVWADPAGRLDIADVLRRTAKR